MSQRQQRIGNDEQADVQLTDWLHAAVHVVNVVNEEGSSIMWTTAAAEGAVAGRLPATAPMPLFDFMPQRFGDVVLCVGPTDAAWPSDAALLATLIQAPELPSSEPKRPRRNLWAVGSGVALALVGAAALSMAYSGPEQEVKLQLALHERVLQALAPADAAQLQIKSEGTKLTVEGLLESGADVARVHSALVGFDGQVVHRYSAASDVVRAIAEAACSARVEVKHQGAGVFLVSGRSADLPQLMVTLQRVAADLNAKVTRINVQVTQDVEKKNNNTASAVYIGRGLQYTQSRDGTRNFSIGEPEAEEASPVKPEPTLTTSPSGLLLSLAQRSAAKSSP